MTETWFERLTGFAEETPDEVRASITVAGVEMTSLANGKRMICGYLETPSLAELRTRVRSCPRRLGRISVREVVANVQHLHTDEKNAGTLFQVASQFNLLEMVSPSVPPERGVGIYENDHTQGPACAIAAGAGTIYRNYFARVDGQIGQSANNQIDCLADLGVAMGNTGGRLWGMYNGYAVATDSGLAEISNRLRSASNNERDELLGWLRIGIQQDTQVTLDNSIHQVSQAYCSALPVAYSNHSSALWAEFATLVLEASYEATLCAAILNLERTGKNTVYLTLLGGGAFGNETGWIIHGIRRALERYADSPLDVAVVSYGTSKPYVQTLIQELSLA